MASEGIITQVIGSTFDARFSEDAMPDIYNAVKVEAEINDIKLDLTGEVQQHLAADRCAASPSARRTA